MTFASSKSENRLVFCNWLRYNEPIRSKRERQIIGAATPIILCTTTLVHNDNCVAPHLLKYHNYQKNQERWILGCEKSVGFWDAKNPPRS